MYLIFRNSAKLQLPEKAVPSNPTRKDNFKYDMCKFINYCFKIKCMIAVVCILLDK